MVQLPVSSILFDLDGTLVNSGPIAGLAWQEEVELHNQNYPDQQIDLEQFLHVTHGTRTLETFKQFFPYKNCDAEGARQFDRNMVVKNGHLGSEIKGAQKFMENLNSSSFKSRWAVVTSGTTGIAYGWFDTLFADVARPSVFVTADDVTNGKPDPEGYLSAYKELRRSTPAIDNAVVFEDAPTGIAAGVRAGFTVIGIASTFTKDTLVAAGATYVISDFTNVVLDPESQTLQLNIL